MIANPIHVAILDDDPSIRIALVRLLKSANMVAHAYASSNELFKSIAKESPDCLLLDLHGSEMNGLDVVRYLNKRGFGIPTLVITGSDTSSREACLNAGAVAYLHKPLDPDRLIRLIEEIVRSSQGGKAQSLS